MQCGDLRIGTGVGEIYQMPVAVLTHTLAGIKIPAEKRIDYQGGVGQALSLVGWQEIVIHLITIV